MSQSMKTLDSCREDENRFGEVENCFGWCRPLFRVEMRTSRIELETPRVKLPAGRAELPTGSGEAGNCSAGVMNFSPVARARSGEVTDWTSEEWNCGDALGR